MQKTSDLTDFRSDEFQLIATSLGEVILAWNDLHELFRIIFANALDTRNDVFAFAIWYSIKSDRAQREMLLSLTNTPALGNKLTQNPKTEVRWILKRADALEDLRNNVIHSPFLSVGDKIDSFWHAGHKRAARLSGQDITARIRKFYDTILTLREYSRHVNFLISSPSYSLPERPKISTT